MKPFRKYVWNALKLGLGVSQILCKHRRAVKNRAKLFVGVVACPPPLEFNIGREMCACQGQRLEGRCSFNP